MCVDMSFDIRDLINIRNDNTEKYCKVIANKISHLVLPFYILNLQSQLKQEDYSIQQLSEVSPNPVFNPMTNMPFQLWGHPMMPYNVPPYFGMHSMMPQYSYSPHVPVKQASDMPVQGNTRPKPIIKPKIKSHNDSTLLIPTEDGDSIPHTVYNCFNNNAYHDSSTPNIILCGTAPDLSGAILT